MFNNVKVLNDYRGDSMTETTRSITLAIRTFEETPLIRSCYETKTQQGIELDFETPGPLLWFGSNYGSTGAAPCAIMLPETIPMMRK